MSRHGVPSLPSFSGANPKFWIDGMEEYFNVYLSMKVYQFILVADLVVGREKEWFMSWSFDDNKEDYCDEFVNPLCELENSDENVDELVGCESTEKK